MFQWTLGKTEENIGLTLSLIEACILYQAPSRLEGAGYKMQASMRLRVNQEHQFMVNLYFFLRCGDIILSVNSTSLENVKPLAISLDDP